MTRLSTRPLPPAPPRCECVNATHNSLKLKWGDNKSSNTLLEPCQYTLEMEKSRNQYVSNLWYKRNLGVHEVIEYWIFSEYITFTDWCSLMQTHPKIYFFLNPQFLPNYYETRWKWATHKYLILTEFCNVWIKNVHFQIKAYFWVSLH